MVPLASGLMNGPCTVASTSTDCQEMPAAGAIAGACALTARSAACAPDRRCPMADARQLPRSDPDLGGQSHSSDR